MKIYYLQNENQEIIEDGFEKFNENCKSMDSTQYKIVNGYNGALFFADYMETDEYKTKSAGFKAKSELNALRYRRETECFGFINRGTIWYDRLTAKQKEELANWYDAWLDITKTKVVPKKPKWLY